MRITVVVTDDEYARLKALADGRPLGPWMKRTMLGQPGNGSTDGKDNQDAAGVRDVRVARQRAGAARGPRTRGSNRHPNARRGATKDLARDAARDSGIAAVQPSDVAVADETPKRKACKVCGLAFCKGHKK